jgi:hypothetical protein
MYLSVPAIVVGMCIGMVVLPVDPPQQPKIPVPKVPLTGPGVDPDMPFFQVVSRANDECARACDTCAAHCATLLAEGRKEHLATMRLCEDCAAICAATSRILSKDGPMSDLMCAACADACKRCGAACLKHSADPIMKRCADECARCEKACRELLKGGNGATPKGEAEKK